TQKAGSQLRWRPHPPRCLSGRTGTARGMKSMDERMNTERKEWGSTKESFGRSGAQRLSASSGGWEGAGSGTATCGTFGVITIRAAREMVMSGYVERMKGRL